MKLSNKILIGFFGFAFIYLTAVFAEVRLRGTPNIINDSNSIAEKVDISGIEYLVLRDVDYRVNVFGSDRAQLEIRSIEGDLLRNLNHHLSGDTLTLSDFQEAGRRMVKINVFVPHGSLKGIRIDGAEASIKDLEQARLNIWQESGRIWMSYNNIERIHLNISRRSILDISETTLDTLSAEVDYSEIRIYSPVHRLEGSMRNKSFMRMGPVEEIEFRKDSTSRLNLYH